jgi:hypothetical protein
MATVRYNLAESHGIRVFYREAGNENAPKVLLLPSFPTALSYVPRPNLDCLPIDSTW